MEDPRQLVRFFRKKSIYAILFLLFILGYGLLILMESGGTSMDALPGKYKWMEGYGAVQNMLGRQTSRDLAYWKDKKGYLYEGKLWDYPAEEADGFAKTVKKVQNQVRENHTRVLVLIPPAKYFPQKETSRYPAGMPTGNSNEVADRFAAQLKKEHIPVLDYREIFMKDKISVNELFYRTDHHWTIPAAFQAFRSLVAWMNEEFDSNLDPDGSWRSLENYERKTYAKQFLGSAGRAVGQVYAGGLEDFTILIPKKAQAYRWSYQSEEGEVVREGTLRDSLLVESHAKAENPYENDCYSVYLNGVSYEDEIQNLSKDEGPSILWIRDSFASPLAVFMAPLCQKMDLVWSLKSSYEAASLLRENRYDYLIFCIYPDNLVKESFEGL